ncbi:MAG TPA: hypothetical protein VM100_02235, partial [Longimicrobiales bacterium]|nr:hypothetical protein [Longimicrobiales bacterium]
TVARTSADRPTEAYARRFEWRVASELAKVGRSNAQLSSVQNEWLRGHGWATKPEPVKVYGPTTKQYNLLDKHAYNLWEVARPNH